VSSGDCCGDEGQLDHEVAGVKAGERSIRPCEPAEPLLDRNDEHGERDDGRQREEPRGERSLAGASTERESSQHQDDEGRPADESRAAVVVGEHGKQHAGGTAMTIPPV
jgi:hypothetical protein